ncbi:MAG: hypothetical protein WA081_23880 [Desulfosalsimonadaceae bacterium]
MMNDENIICASGFVGGLDDNDRDSGKFVCILQRVGKQFGLDYT